MRTLAAVVVAVLGTAVLPGMWTAPAAAGGAMTSIASAGTVVPDDSAAIAEATVQALESGEPVVVDELTTPTLITTALPEGGVQVESTTVPVRVERDGEWLPVDLNLVLRDGWWEPNTTVSGVRFSAGGSDVVDQVQSSETDWITEVWPHGILPEPKIDGPRATYEEILPGVDLVLTANEVGMSSIYVVKTPEAATSIVMSELSVQLEDATLARDDGVLTATIDDTSDSTLVAGEPLWWDSSRGGGLEGPGGIRPPMPVEHEVTTDGLLLDVPETVTDIAKPTYPVFIDPDWSNTDLYTWYTDAAYPNQNYLNFDTGRLAVGVGYENGVKYMSDMFFRFSLPNLNGKVLMAAHLNTIEIDGMCPVGGLNIHRYGPPPQTGFTWNEEQSWSGLWGPVLQYTSGSSCSQGNTAVGWDVKNGIQTTDTNITFAVTFNDPTTNSRRHFARAASLVVTYDSPPDIPTNPTISSPPRACGTASSPAPVPATSVVVTVNQTDPDPGNVDTNFELFTADNLVSRVDWKYPGLIPQGTRSVTFSGLTSEKTYAWRARGSDWIVDGIGYSPWCYFRPDVTKPTLPVLSSTATTFTVGKPLTLKITGPADVAGYVYWVVPSKITSTAPSVPVDGTVSTTTALPQCAGAVSTNVRRVCGTGSATTPASVTVAPMDAYSTVWVSAYDQAGNQSLASGFKLYGTNAAAPANIDAGHAWRVTALTSPLPLTVPDSNPWIGSNAISLKLPSSTWTGRTDVIRAPGTSPVIGFTSAADADAVKTSKTPVNATNSFSVNLWVKPTAVPSGERIIAQQSGSGRGSYKITITSGGKYSFCIEGAAASDDNGRPVSGCVTGGSVAANGWQMITGIWDASNQQMRLLVGTSTVPVAAGGHVVGSGDWSANGPLVLRPGPNASRFSGLIANPTVVPGVLNTNQLAQLGSLFLPFTP